MHIVRPSRAASQGLLELTTQSTRKSLHHEFPGIWKAHRLATLHLFLWWLLSPPPSFGTALKDCSFFFQVTIFFTPKPLQGWLPFLESKWVSSLQIPFHMVFLWRLPYWNLHTAHSTASLFPPSPSVLFSHSNKHFQNNHLTWVNIMHFIHCLFPSCSSAPSVGIPECF